MLNSEGMTLNADDNSITRFCAVEYRTSETDSLSAPERIVLLFLRTSSGALRVLSHRNWQNIVRPGEMEYVRELMDDFRVRARCSPDALFRQVASLSVGPLRTFGVGDHFNIGTQTMIDICRNMVDFEEIDAGG